MYIVSRLEESVCDLCTIVCRQGRNLRKVTIPFFFQCQNVRIFFFRTHLFLCLSQVVKESTETAPGVSITVNSPPKEQETATPNSSPGPIAPRRMLPQDRAAVLPPTARASGGKQSPETRRLAEASAEDVKLTTEDLKKGVRERGRKIERKKIMYISGMALPFFFF